LTFFYLILLLLHLCSVPYVSFCNVGPGLGVPELFTLWIDFDDIWQKYSEGSRIEFACFSFYVSLHVVTLSCLKVHTGTENNACMLCASVSC